MLFMFHCSEVKLIYLIKKEMCELVEDAKKLCIRLKQSINESNKHEFNRSAMCAIIIN